MLRLEISGPCSAGTQTGSQNWLLSIDRAMEGKNSAPQAHAWLTLWHQHSKRWTKREAIGQS